MRWNVIGLAAMAAALHSRDAFAIRKPVPPGVPMLNPDDAQAQALSYTPDVTEVDAKKLNLAKSPAEAGQVCSNCQLYTGAAGAEWGPCAIFSYRLDPATRQNLVVAADGWCRGWAPRAS